MDVCLLSVISCRTMDSLYEELVDEGILVRYPKVQMSEFLGEFR